MINTTLKAVPLTVLLLASSAAGVLANDDPPVKKEKKIVVIDDGVFSSDGEDPAVRRRHRQGYLGVRLLEMTPELRAHYGAPRDAGVLVAGVEAGSPAAKAGIEVGDIITTADGERIESARDLSRVVRRMKAREALKVAVSRSRAGKQMTVVVEERRTSELDLGDLGRDIGRDVGRRLGRDLGSHAWVFRDHPENLDRLQERLEELEKRLNDLEKKLPAR